MRFCGFCIVILLSVFVSCTNDNELAYYDLRQNANFNHVHLPKYSGLLHVTVAWDQQAKKFDGRSRLDYANALLVSDHIIKQERKDLMGSDFSQLLASVSAYQDQ